MLSPHVSPAAPRRRSAPDVGSVRAIQAEYLPDALAVGIFFILPMDIIGPLGVLGWLGLFGMLVLARAKSALMTVLRWWPLMLTPVIAILSTLWSDLPGVSLRYGIQLFITVFLGIFIARLLGPRRFAIALFIATMAFCLVSIASQRQGISADGMVLIGLTGSKNQMAYSAHMLFASALAILFDKGSPKPLRLAAAPGILMALYLIASVNAATALLMAIISTTVFFYLVVVRNLRPATRAATLLAGVLVLAPFSFAVPEVQDAIASFRQDVLHKDEGLTGRTYLWRHADDMISRRPLLGYGYQAVWMGDSPEIIGIMRWAGQSDGRAFHFHHTYRQIAVDTGLIGMAVFAGIMLTTLLAGMRQSILQPNIMSAFYFSFFVATLMRSFADVIIGPFSLQPAVFFAACTFAFWQGAPPPLKRTGAPVRIR